MESVLLQQCMAQPSQTRQLAANAGKAAVRASVVAGGQDPKFQVDDGGGAEGAMSSDAALLLGLRSWLEVEVIHRLSSLDSRLDAAMPFLQQSVAASATAAGKEAVRRPSQGKWPWLACGTEQHGDKLVGEIYDTELSGGEFQDSASDAMSDAGYMDDVPDERIGIDPLPPRIPDGDTYSEDKSPDVLPIGNGASYVDFGVASANSLGPGPTNSSLLRDVANPTDALVVAVKAGKLRDIIRALEGGGNPNAELAQFRLHPRGNEFRNVALLAVAVLRSRRDVAKQLLMKKADPNCSYSFKSGGGHKADCVLPASHASVAHGDLSMLKLLVDNKADLSATSTNKANLVWQAAYFGQVSFISYLLSKRVKIDEPATSLDSEDERHTPLQIAARQGHSQVISMLLDRRARINGSNGSMSTPLEDAIIAGNGECVRVLVSRGARLFGATGFSQEFLACGGVRSQTFTLIKQTAEPDKKQLSSKQDIPLNVLFDRANCDVIAKAARGLQSAHVDELDKLTVQHFLRFLRTPGKAPVEILRASFRKHAVKYWEANSPRTVYHGLVHPSRAFNVCEGPSYRSIVRLYNSKASLKQSPEGMRFLDRLAPRPGRGKFIRSWDIASNYGCYDLEIWMCHVQGIGKNMEVLCALADQPDREIFSEIGFRVLLHLCYENVVGTVRRMMLLEILHLVCFCWFVTFLHRLNQKEEVEADAFNLITGACLGFAFVETVLFCAYQAGCHKCHLRARVHSPWKVLECLRLLAALILLTYCLGEGIKLEQRSAFKTVLAVLAFIRWMKLIDVCKASPGLGGCIRPITMNMWNARPYVAVLLMYLAGCTTAYYSLGIKDLLDSFTLIFRIVVMGDLDMDEIEGYHEVVVPLSNTTSAVELTRSSSTIDSLPLRMLMLGASFFLGLALVNVFIAVLCASVRASTEADPDSASMIASIAFDYRAIQVGLRRILCCFFWRQGQSRKDPDEADSDSAKDTDFLWYSVPKQRGAPGPA